MAGTMNFNVQEANDWKNDVNNLFADVGTELDAVTKECETSPGEDDTIFLEIEKAGKNLKLAWDGLKDIFDALIIAIGKIFENIGEFILEAAERVQTFGENFET